MNDEEIMDLYFERLPKAVELTRDKYSGLCKAVSFNILNSIEDVEEVLNDSLLVVWNTIPPKRPQSLKAYLCAVAKNLSLKKYNYNNALKRNSEYDKSLDELKQCCVQSDLVEGIAERNELVSKINAFLRDLPAEKRILFLRRYYFSEPVKLIAQDYSISEKNASIKIARIRGQLKKYLEKEGYMND